MLSPVTVPLVSVTLSGDGAAPAMEGGGEGDDPPVSQQLNAVSIVWWVESGELIHFVCTGD